MQTRSGVVVMWRLKRLASLHWRCWDEEWVLYNQGSGDTHVLDAFTALTLMALEEGPANSTQLLTHLGAHLAGANDGAKAAAAQEKMQTVLQQLERVGLIEGVEA